MPAPLSFGILSRSMKPEKMLRLPSFFFRRWSLDASGVSSPEIISFQLFLDPAELPSHRLSVSSAKSDLRVLPPPTPPIIEFDTSPVCDESTPLSSPFFLAFFRRSLADFTSSDWLKISEHWDRQFFNHFHSKIAMDHLPGMTDRDDLLSTSAPSFVFTARMVNEQERRHVYKTVQRVASTSFQ
eukprot:CAMPEP_0185795880 /NCGR_PEP_ID=MMETSP1174-20130828/160781_1 /TAXON_ID=35687 /ORGANISM="Dictyocha speculum, Strain CCMP1381" /LENGTH=183 /DNA_ID=CAMNT_0028491201 /DNA_START=194 /DNA_END=746 /DNA_ORIENTATION=-